jgi:hypothetical protein
MVAPIITVIDRCVCAQRDQLHPPPLGTIGTTLTHPPPRSIMENASGKNPMKASLRKSLTTLLLRPHSLIFSKPFALVCAVYGGTYLTANTIDTVESTVRNKSPTLVTAGTLKFAASSSANIGIGIFKDQVFAKMFGPGGPPRPVPGPSYALFALRDCMTIFASFNVPPLLGPVLSNSMSAEMQKVVAGQTAAQFLAPAGIQLLSTTVHLLGLDLYNRHQEHVSWRDRWSIVKKNWGVSVVARICRIVPAFGFGGVVNSKVRRRLMERLE